MCCLQYFFHFIQHLKNFARPPSFHCFTNVLFLPLQSWHVSFSSAWTTSTGSVSRIQTPSSNKALHCSTCGPLVRVKGPRVSEGDLRLRWISLICHLIYFFIFRIFYLYCLLPLDNGQSSFCSCLCVCVCACLYS